jgi:2-polyprenyl-3-methyl-5-hydroxy-6-metoxy-1,4-benzoquinol methylase
VSPHGGGLFDFGLFEKKGFETMATAQQATLDQSRVDAMTEKLVGILNGGSLALMISLGHRSGLFDAMAKLPPSSSEGIAAAAGLNERYVREWLGAMVVGGIVEYDPASRDYHLPAEHASLLTRGATPSNLAATMQWISVLGYVEDKVLDCFHNGGGVPYEAYHRFHEVMAEESAQTVVAALVDHILPLADGIADQLERGIDVLDVGCGSGMAACRLAEAFPNSRVMGYDICQDAVDVAWAEAQRRDIPNVRFETFDLAKLTDVGRFDLITAFDIVHDQANPAKVLAGIYRALKDDGTFLMQDIHASSHVEKNLDNPLASTLYTISCMHCMTVSLAQGGAGLGACWGHELAHKMLAEAGFSQVRRETLPHDELNYYYVCGK